MEQIGKFEPKTRAEREHKSKLCHENICKGKWRIYNIADPTQRKLIEADSPIPDGWQRGIGARNFNGGYGGYVCRIYCNENGKTYESMTSAAEDLGITISHVSLFVNNRIKNPRYTFRVLGRHYIEYKDRYKSGQARGKQTD